MAVSGEFKLGGKNIYIWVLFYVSFLLLYFLKELQPRVAFDIFHSSYNCVKSKSHSRHHLLLLSSSAVKLFTTDFLLCPVLAHRIRIKMRSFCTFFLSRFQHQQMSKIKFAKIKYRDSSPWPMCCTHTQVLNLSS